MSKNLKAILSIRHIKNLPKLGLYSLPSPYIIIKSNESQYTTGISPPSCNPYWNYENQVCAKQQLQIIQFFVFNSNSNAEDELIAYGSIQFQKLLTNVVSQSKILLKDAKNNVLRSELLIEHSSANPNFHNIAQYDSRTVINLTYLRMYSKSIATESWLEHFNEKCISLFYNNNSKQISSNYPQASFRFHKQCLLLKSRLGLDKITIENQIRLDNMSQNCSTQLIFYFKQHQICCDVCVRIIKRGYIPDDYNILSFELQQILIQPQRKKNKNWAISLHSAFTNKVFNQTKVPISLYIQNNTMIKIDYFDDPEGVQIKDLQPTSTLVFNINSINWSQNHEGSDQYHLYNQVKGLSILLKCKFQLLKSSQQKSILAPQWQKPQFLIDKGHSSYKINAIKMSYACFSQIFPEKTLFKFVYISKFGQISQFPSFQIRNYNQIVIPSKRTVRDQQGGMLYLTTFDHFFGKQEEKQTFLNHVICKMQVKDLALLEENRIMYNQKFLAFAKKITMTKVCKKFDQMIRDKTLKITLGLKQIPTFYRGQLTIHNCILKGQKNQVKVTLKSDSNEFVMEGITDSYMLLQPYKLIINSKQIIIRLQYSNNVKQLHIDFQQLFGTPTQNNMYKLQFPISSSDNLHLVYSFKKLVQKQQKHYQNIKIIQENSRFTEDAPVYILPKSLKLSSESYESYVLKVSRCDTILQTQSYNPSANQLKFSTSEKMFLKGSQKKIIKENNKVAPQGKYIFFNLYCLSKEKGNKNQNKEDEQIQKLIIYSGHFDVSSFIGKGFYQLILTQSNQNNKKTVIVQFQLLCDKPIDLPEAKLKLEQISCSDSSIFKQAYKYYLVAESNFIILDILEMRRDMNVGQTVMKINQQLKIKRGDCILWKLYSSLRSLPKENFWSGQKQLVASGTQFWTSFKDGECYVNLRFRPLRQMKAKYNSNKLSILENTIKIKLKSLFKAVDNTELSVLKKKPRSVDLDLLHSGAGVLNILEVIPSFSQGKNIQFSLKQPLKNDECKFCCFGKLPIYSQYLIGIQNMNLKFEIIKSYKIGENYRRKAANKIINLRGKYLKTNENFGLNLNFPGICSIKANLTVISNKFTNNPVGKLTLRQFQFKGQPLKGIQIYPLSNSTILYNTQKLQNIEPFRYGLQNKTSISLDNRQIWTNDIGFCLYITLVLENKKKVKTLIQLAKIDIEKLEDKQFTYQWLVEGTTTYLLSFSGEYVNHHLHKSDNQSVNYYLQMQGTTKQIAINYPESIYKELQLEIGAQTKPDRKLGYKVILDMPDKLRSQNISLVLQDGSLIPLIKYQHNSQIFIIKGFKEHKIKTIKIKAQKKQDVIQKIQELENKNFYRRFLINRDNRYIAYLSQQKFAIADISPQTMTVSFSFHSLRILTENLEKIIENRKKIACMENNPYDQILTKNFGLYIKHGSQCKTIRVIDQYGMLISDSKQKHVVFGYQPQVDELQIYLYINHSLNEKQNERTLIDFQQKLKHNWMKYLPISSGKISLQKIGQNSFVGCQLIPIINEQQTVDRALNKVIVRQKLGCFGVVRMQKKKWGFINLKFKEVSAVELEGSGKRQLLYFEFIIENTQKKKIASFVTQAREIRQSTTKYSKNNEMNFKFIQQNKGQMYSLKIIGRVIDLSGNYQLFQKRIDMTQMLNKPIQKYQFSVKIKTTQATGLSQPMQINLIFNNTKQIIKQQIQDIASQINTVDIVKFQNNSEQELIKKMMQCEQFSHLYQNLKQIKQSIIYSKQIPLLTLQWISNYLCFQNDRHILDVCLDSLIFALTKYPKCLSELNKKSPEIMQILYNNCKTISTGKQLESQSPQAHKISVNKYHESKTKLDIKKSSIQDFQRIINYQKKVLYPPNQIIKTHNDQIIFEKTLMILEVLLKENSKFKDKIINQIQVWNQCYVFKDQKIFLQYINIIQVLLRNSEVQTKNQIRKRVIDICLDRHIGQSIVVEMWQNLNGPDRAQYSNKLANYLGDLLKIEENNSINAFKTFINYLSLHHIKVEADSIQKSAQKIIQKIRRTQQIKKITLYSQIMIKLKNLKLLNQKDQNILLNILKKKKDTYPEKSKKLVLVNIIDRILGKQISGAHKNTQNQNEGNKNHFYKKYLITS